ncbi:uncharacterized protein LOC131880362 [Tigriopus californicus]|uniref:uncharacterized protein LOC131880362 n=1 Tax=Tigriopus californicus TaxID=6832 RepID=UPI0027DA1651|nr:uncharacterized protein LOC131880362 [Tigriopus californicus]
MCAHVYTCTCQRYAYSNLCKHMHVLAMLEASDDTSIESDPSTEENCPVTVKPPLSNSLSDETDQPNEVGQGSKSDKEEVSAFLNDCSLVKERIRLIEAVLRAEDLNVCEKKVLMKSCQARFADLINLSYDTNLNPSCFPRLDRKRVHQPPNRSFFPTKKAKQDHTSLNTL